MEKELMEVGYIRTNCFNKLIGLFKDKIIVSLECARSRQEKQVEKTDYPWLKWDTEAYGRFTLDWDMWKNKTSWDVVFKAIMNYREDKFLYDFTVKKIQVGYTYDSKLWKIIDNLTPISEMQKMRKMEEKDRVFITFISKPLAYTNLIMDGKSDIVSKINRSVINNLSFKKGVMDLDGVKIERGKGHFDNADFLVHKPKFLDRALSKLNTDEWFKLPEIQTMPESKLEKTPCAVRTIKTVSKEKWEWIKDRSIQYESNGDKE